MGFGGVTGSDPGHQPRSWGRQRAFVTGRRFFLLAFFHSASRVAVAEAFLARRVGVVHLLSQDEEPAQCPQEAPNGIFWAWVRDVGFRHSVVSLPLPQAPARGRATRGNLEPDTGAYSTRRRSDGAMRGGEGKSSSAPLTVW